MLSCLLLQLVRPLLVLLMEERSVMNGGLEASGSALGVVTHAQTVQKLAKKKVKQQPSVSP